MVEETAIPTLADVAARAGVSTATVSRVLNSPDKVAPKTRERVARAVADLGYSPNFGARVMAARQTKTVGAVIPTMENAIFAKGLQAFQEALHEYGYTLLVASTGYDAEVEDAQIRALVARGADALLLIGHSRGRGLYDFLARQEVPAVVTWAVRPDDAGAVPSIGFDNRQAMRELAGHVIGLGHRHLALISAEIAQNDRAAERRAGVRAALADKGLSPDALIYVETPYGFDEGSVAFAQVMAKRPRPTAVLCGNDVLAAGALRQARAMGLDVPGEVSITGFDDIDLAQILHPPLTTVRVPHRDMGRQAALALIGHLTGAAPLSSATLDTSIVLRDTLAPPGHT
ncbi:LacI family DNA-binding transcriptional regulator [Thalassorhabdomicrobium marinisediminis]|uniref:LacI family transcriptional regulator n=1 Tax=Thalassorhabdomicrobium marinisediminis TaxID=2170577 RepID=A0A2T7G0H8_9RHOB|nr:LacI family DNA-binding transcriptional regulator [Thalassorhabdomicrobium marinisediminis]PVA07926.1 LacI family transcriptional regulator [Thalassorhabdomicrobium marinisediminis]